MRPSLSKQWAAVLIGTFALLYLGVHPACDHAGVLKVQFSQ